MSGGKQTPRQKMIGMMYLVLTALLALNVSKSILDAFINVNNGLQITNSKFEARNEQMYADFAKAKAENPAKVGEFYKSAEEAKKLSAEMNKYIDELKKELILATDQNPEMLEEAFKDIAKVSSKDNYDIPSHHLCGTAVDGSNGKARELKNKLIEFKKKMISLIQNPKIVVVNREKVIKDLADLGINTDDRKEKSQDNPEKNYWETDNFYHNVIVADLCILTKMQNDVKNAESQIVSILLSQIGAADFKFDTIAARVIAKTNYVIQGTEYEADLFVAAFSKTDTTTQVYVGNSSVPVQNGVGKYKIRPMALGEQKYTALIKVKEPATGKYREYPIESSYIVAKPSVVVSPIKMNVFYIDVDNPVDISVAGFSADKISATMSPEGTIVKDPKTGIYNVRVKKPVKTNISVTVKDAEGKPKPMGSIEFRCKNVPDPVAMVLKKKGGRINKNELATATKVEAILENFDFELKYTVTEFVVSATVDGYIIDKQSKSERFTDQQLGLIKALKKGNKVYIEKIKAQGPGKIRDLALMYFEIN